MEQESPIAEALELGMVVPGRDDDAPLGKRTPRAVLDRHSELVVQRFVDLAGYMYDAAGNPTWYITVVETPNPLRIAGNWWTFANGQATTGPYRPATRTSDNAGAVAIDFSSPTTATLTLPDGRRVPLVRQAF